MQFFAQTLIAAMTKKEALEKLKSNSFQWQQTKLLALDAQAKTQQANSAFYPHAGLYARQFIGKINQMQYGFADPGILNWFGAGTSGVQFGYSIFDQSAVDRLNAAKQNELINSGTAAQYQNDLTYVMLAEFLNIQRLKKNLIVIDANLDRDQQIFEAAQKKVKAGFGISLDVNRAEGLLEHEKLKKLNAKTTLFKACEEFALTVGQTNFYCDLEPLELKTIDESTLEKIGRELISKRPDLSAIQATVQAEEHLKNMEKNSSKPKISLYGELGTFGTYPFDGFTKPTGVFGIQITMPVFTGGLHEAQVQEEAVKLTKATLQSKQIELESESQFRIALSQLKDARATLDVAEKNVSLAKDELSISQKKFSAGSASSLDISSAIVNLATAQDLNIQSIFGYEIAKLNYFKSIGNFNQYLELEGIR